MHSVITSGLTPNTKGLAALPNDVLLNILEALDSDSALRLQQVCKSLYVFATSRPAWLAIARAVSRAGVLPLPSHTTYPTPASLSTSDMKAAIRKGITTQRALARPSPVLHVHSHLGAPSGLPPNLAYSLLSDQPVVHSAFLPGGRFLLTVQLDSSFACWDLESSTRTRSVHLQTGFDTVVEDETVGPHCVAYWKTGGAYVEFAYDVVEEGDAVIVALLTFDILPDQALSRYLHVLRIDLPAPNARCPPRPPIPDECLYNISLLASALIPNPCFVCSSYVHASGHAGLIATTPSGAEVIFTVFFNPRPPPRVALASTPILRPFAEASAAVAALANSRVALVQCSFRTKPTRFYALGSAEHIILYCESGACVYSRVHDAVSIRAQAFGRSITEPPLVIPSHAPHEDPYPAGEQGTPGAPNVQKMSVVLQRPGPAWLEHGDDWAEQARRTRNQTYVVSAITMMIDAEMSNSDAFRGVVVGVHDVDVDRKDADHTGASDEMQVDGEVTIDATRPDHVPNPRASSSSPPRAPTPPHSSAAAASTATPQPPSCQPTRYRRECRVRYKRTVFPSRLLCAWHELAAIGTHGRRAVWIEGDGAPLDEGQLGLEPHDESDSLRVMLTCVGRDGSEAPLEVNVPEEVRAQLSLVSCVAFDDSAGVLALSTLHGRVMLLQFA